MPAALVPAQYPKPQIEVAPVIFDFSKRKVILAGQTILAAQALQISPLDGGLSAGSPAVSGAQVQYMMTGGTLGTNYTLVCLVITSGGCTLRCEGQLQIVP